MTSLKQIAANRRNALKSTGPTTSEGKQRSRCNAVRHGLTAETVIVGSKMQKITKPSKLPSLQIMTPDQQLNVNLYFAWQAYYGDCVAQPELRLHYSNW